MSGNLLRGLATLGIATLVSLAGCQDTTDAALDADLHGRCGDGYCSRRESCSSCPRDCGVCAPDLAFAPDMSTAPAPDMNTAPTPDMSTTTPPGTSCTATSGALTLHAKVVRAAGTSPFLVFFDATATTDSATLGGANNTIQDVYYSWSFGDTSAVSGSGSTWSYGSNAGRNNKNTATGPVAAHLYITNGSDTSHTVTVTANDGTNTASCQLGVTAYDPAGASGYPGSATTCVAASTMPVAGAGGCPAGAAVLQQSDMGAALTAAFGSKKRVLFKCGDTFSGRYGVASTVNNASIGAYGGCENTSTNRPIFNNTSGHTLELVGTRTATGGAKDVRVADIDFEAGTNTDAPMIVGYEDVGTYVSQITFYNLKCRVVGTQCVLSEGTQSGIIGSDMAANNYVMFLNVGGSACLNYPAANSSATYCGNASYDQSYYANVSYNAWMGNRSDESGALPGSENVRIGACRMCVFSNNTLTHVYGSLGLLKITEGKTPQVNMSVWDGQNTEIFEISDNLFTNGPNNGYSISYAPQNQQYNEHLRYGIIERNLWFMNNGEATGPLIAASNTTVRDNVAYSTNTVSTYTAYGFYGTHQGGEPPETGQEFYNNTCYGPTALGRFGTACAQTDANTNSFLANNLVYNAGAAIPAAGISTGNTVSNNTTSSTLNFNPANASGTFTFLSDFKPTANYAGATSVPNWYDGLGTSWKPTWDLGAIHH
jgi:hypothetical protein